jgi:LysM repeat protein
VCIRALPGAAVLPLTVAVLDACLTRQERPPGSTLTVEKLHTLIEDTAGVKQLPFRAMLHWTPRLQDAGLPDETGGRGVFEVSIGSAAQECRFKVHRIVFKVYKCKYCVNEKESMHSIAQRFSTHWTQIWSTNHQLETPDTLSKGQEITLGNFYRTVKGDTWKLIAVRFGTTVERLMELNRDLTSETMTALVPANSQVCVMPDTCPERRIPHEGITW